MRIFSYLIAIIFLIGSASANRPVSGVVAVSTGPMQAKYTDAMREIGRDLVAGDNVFLNDEVETGRKTQAQVMLKDESVFSISPNSKVMFDEFIYDPFAQTGALSARLLGGGVRFVSGKIANRQPQNVTIKAGTATVGIRGTEIVAKHSDEGSTFVLLSGAMEVSTPAGLQTINRPGFGLDVSADGRLGDVRRVPLQEINQLLAPPASADEDSATDDSAEDDSSDGDSEEASTEDDNAETAADEETTSEDGETSNADAESAAAKSDTASTEDKASAETETKSSFDSALVAAAKSDGDREQAEVSGLADLNLEVAAETTTSSDVKSKDAANADAKSNEIAADDVKTADTESTQPAAEEPVLRLALAIDEPSFSGENATASIIDALVEDKKDERGTTVAEEIAREQDTGPEPQPEPETRPQPETLPETLPETQPETLPETQPETLPETQPETLPETQPEPVISLALETSGTLTDNPYFSSDAKLLVRSSPFFQAGDEDQFNITHAIMKEKFPESFDDNDFKYYTRRPNYADNYGVAEPDLVTDLTPYDAVLIYAGWFSRDELTAAEITEYSRAVQDTENGLKVLLIGRQTTSNPRVNSIMNIFDYTDAGDGKDYEYRSAYYASGNSTDTLQPILDSEGEPVSELLAGVTEFPQYYNDSGFGRIDFNKAEAPNDGDDLVSFDNGLLSSETDDHIVAMDFGDQGAAFIGRWSCGANGEGNLGTSINANLVNNGREQFCRNLISSIAPDDSLVDVEVGTLSVSGTDETASYRLISGGSDNFKIIDDRLILDRDASLVAGSYDLTIGVTPTGGDEIERTVSVSVADGDAEKRVISTRDTYNVGDTVSFPTENLVSHTGYLEDISWVSIGDSSGGGTPTNTGIVTLHYRIIEGDTTYDRFHEIEINHDCSSDHCKEFATSMDTEDNLDEGQHFEVGETVSNVFEANDFTSWSSFFDRFTTGTGRFASRDFQGTWPVSVDYHYDLEISYGGRAGILEADGTLAGHTLDERWEFDFLQSGGACESHICFFEDNSDNYDLNVYLANISLPNGKHSIMLNNQQYWNGSGTNYGWSPMTPQ